MEAKKIVDTTKPELSIFLFQNNLEEEGTAFYVSEIIVHPDWDILNKRYEADIAIVILKEPVEISSNVTNICLNSPSKPVENFIGKDATVCGWGHIENSFKPVKELRAVTVPIVEQKNCNESRVLREISSDTLFCAGSTNITAGPCKG